MALKKSYSSKFGTSHTQAYHKITNLRLFTSNTSASSGSIEYAVATYATSAAKAAGSASLDETHYTFEYTGSIDESFVSQSYEHLKALDAYSGSADV